MNARDWLWQLFWAAIGGALAGSFIAAAGPAVDYTLEGTHKQGLRPSTVFAFATVGALIMMGMVIAVRLTQR
ncbi:MAG: hypothetical protein H5T64_00905 [Chloroflexi bacterium]|nr:hypothetical protein [Chloroflexota bacterium]